MGEVFDFQRFLKNNDTQELGNYAIFFAQKAENFKKTNRDKVPDYQNALRIREQQMLFDTTATTRINAANEYTSLGFYELFVPDGKAAEMSIRRAIALDSTNIYTYVSLAPALLLQGLFEEAKTKYLQWGQKPFSEQFPTYRDVSRHPPTTPHRRYNHPSLGGNRNPPKILRYNTRSPPLSHAPPTRPPLSTLRSPARPRPHPARLHPNAPRRRRPHGPPRSAAGRGHALLPQCPQLNSQLAGVVA